MTLSLPGVWRGYMSVVTCDSTCGSERTIGFVLRVAGGGPGFVGSFEPDISGWLNVVVDVTGAVQPDASVLFTGTREPFAGDLYTYEVTRLLVKIDQASGLAGDVSLRGTYPAGWTRSVTGRILSASYLPDVALPGANFSGTWRGLFVIRACSGYCPAYMRVGSTDRIEFAFGQSGSAVSGQLEMSNFYCGSCWLPVAGSVTGRQLSLASDIITRNPSDGIGDKTMHLESFTGTMDAVGRISGRFVYSSTTRNYATPSDVFYRIEGEILWCTRSWPALR